MKPAWLIVARARAVLAESHDVTLAHDGRDAWHLTIDERPVRVCRTGPREPTPYLFVLGTAEPRDYTDAPTGSALAESIELYLERRR